MFGIVLSALNAALAWVFQSVLLKFVIFFALYFVTTEFFELIKPMLPQSQNISASFGMLLDPTQYFLSVFNIPTGISMVISAYTSRFIIRRIPVIG